MANWVQLAELTRDGLSGPLLMVPTNPDPTAELTRDGLSGPLLMVPTDPDAAVVRATAGWETELLLPVVVSARTSATTSPTDMAAAISAVVT